MIELAWAAGFFDGEGSTTKHHGVYPSLTINQVGRECLDRFHAAVGLGVIRGPYGPYGRGKNGRGENWQPQFIYSTRNWRETKQVADKLRPFLSGPKCLQIDSVFEEFFAKQEANPRLGARPKSHDGICGRGHSLENAIVRPSPAGKINRTCRVCHNEVARVWAAKNRAVLAG